jgi:Rho-binding antiterminator
MEQGYQPIACMQHERLEFSVLRRIMLELTYAGKRERVLPLDVATRNGAEWLKFRRADGSEEEIRLDRIESFKEILA